MKKIMRLFLTWTFFCSAMINGMAGSLDEAIPGIRDALAEKLREKKTTRVAAVDFTDFRGRPNELGRYLAENVDG